MELPPTLAKDAPMEQAAEAKQAKDAPIVERTNWKLDKEGNLEKERQASPSTLAEAKARPRTKTLWLPSQQQKMEVDVIYAQAKDKNAMVATATQGNAKRAKHKEDELRRMKDQLFKMKEEQREDNENRKMKELMTMMANRTMDCAQHAQTLRAIVIHCIKIEADHKRDKIEYEQLKELIGIPSMMGFDKSVVGVYTQLQDNHLAKLEDKDQQSYEKFEAQKYYVAKMTKGCWEMGLLQLYNPPTEENWDMSDWRRTGASTNWLEAWGEQEVMILWPRHVWIMIKRQIVGEERKEMQGLVPAVDLERKIMEYLEGERKDQD